MTSESFSALIGQEILQSRRGIFGVPDSTLTELISVFETNPRHSVAANEGSAVGMAIGHWLQSRLPAHVYMQNSGLLNAGNPLISLAHQGVYDVPMTLTVGWRGQPDHTDEPQHMAMGATTVSVLELFGFEVRVIESQIHYLETICEIHTQEESRLALLVPRGIFDARRSIAPLESEGVFTRLAAIEELHSTFGNSRAFVSGTGYMSRDLSSIRASSSDMTEGSVFYLVGGMGHVSSVAAGIASAGRAERVIAIEGDGGALMHLGSLSTLGTEAASGVDLFILQNGVHASVGCQPIVHPEFDFLGFANACGVKNVAEVKSHSELKARLESVALLQPKSESSITVVQVRETQDQSVSPRPSGFSSLARRFKQ
jgi:phosphonopyruvate decarboxylase